MSRKRTHRKHRYLLLNPVQFAIEGAAIVGGKTLEALQRRELSAIEAFRTGRAGEQEWLDIADMLNISETMSLGGCGPEALESCERAQQELAEMHERHHKEGRAMVMTGPGLQALRDAWEYHDLQRRSIPRADYERYIKRTHDRIRSNSPGLRVCAA